MGGLLGLGGSVGEEDQAAVEVDYLVARDGAGSPVGLTVRSRPILAA